MKQFIWDFFKIAVIFICCTCIFYIGLRFMYQEYEERHRYDEPIGPAVKVFDEESGLIDRIQLYFRLGE